MKQITLQKSSGCLNISHQINSNTKKTPYRNKIVPLCLNSKHPMSSTKSILTSTCASIKLSSLDLSFAPIIKVNYNQLPQNDISEKEEKRLISFIQNSIIEKGNGKYTINTNELIKYRPLQSLIDETILPIPKNEDLCNSSRYLYTSATTKSYTSTIPRPRKVIKQETILKHNGNICDSQRKSMKIQKIQLPSTLSSRKSISPIIKSERLKTLESNSLNKKKHNKQIDDLIDKFFKNKGFKM